MDFPAIVWIFLVFCSPVLMVWLGWKVWQADKASSPIRSKLTFAFAIISSLSLVILFVTTGTLILQMPY